MKKVNEFKRSLEPLRVKETELLSSHTSFRLGGPSSLYCEVSSIDELVKVASLAHETAVPVRVIGGGTNAIISENGLEGLVIKNNCRKFDVLGISGRVLNQKLGVETVFVYAESGVIFNQLVRFTIEQGLSGLEYQLGLPGTVGGAVAMNSLYSKMEKYVSDSVYKARVLTCDGHIKEVDSSYFAFSHDSSSVQTNGDVILSVTFQFQRENPKSLWKKGTEALEHRTLAQPKHAVTGLTYRNISIDRSKTKKVIKFTPEELIGRANLLGKSVGGVMISPLSPHFLINTGNAKAKDVSDLIQLVKDEIAKKFGVTLLFEERILGNL